MKPAPHITPTNSTPIASTNTTGYTPAITASRHPRRPPVPHAIPVIPPTKIPNPSAANPVPAHGIHSTNVFQGSSTPSFNPIAQHTAPNPHNAVTIGASPIA